MAALVMPMMSRAVGPGVLPLHVELVVAAFI
jgi:hypothetical protein